MTKEDFIAEVSCSPAFIKCLKNNDRELLVEYGVAHFGTISEEIYKYVKLFDIVKKYPMIEEKDIEDLIEFVMGYSYY